MENLFLSPNPICSKTAAKLSKIWALQMKRSRNETRFSPNPNNPGLKPQSGHLDHDLIVKWYHGSLWHLFFLHARDGLIDLRRLG